MKDWHFCMILLGVYYQVENPFPVPQRKWNSQKNWVCIKNCNTEVKRKYTAKCLALEVNKRLTILHDFNGSILQNWSSISCLTFGKWRKQLVLLISNWRGNILYNVQLWMYMSDWHFCMILMGLHYQVEILFPVSHLKKKNIGETIWISFLKNEKTGFALIIEIKNSRGNRLYNVYLLKHMKDWQSCMIVLEVFYLVENQFPFPHRKWNYQKNWFCITEFND